MKKTAQLENELLEIKKQAAEIEAKREEIERQAAALEARADALNKKAYAKWDALWTAAEAAGLGEPAEHRSPDNWE